MAWENREDDGSHTVGFLSRSVCYAGEFVSYRYRVMISRTAVSRDVASTDAGVRYFQRHFVRKRWGKVVRIELTVKNDQLLVVSERFVLTKRTRSVIMVI